MKRKLTLVTLVTMMLAGCAGGKAELAESAKQLSFIGAEVADTEYEVIQRDNIIKELKKSKDSSEKILNTAFNNMLNSSGIIIVTSEKTINNKKIVTTVNAAEFGDGYLNVIFPDSSYISYVKNGSEWRVTSYPDSSVDKEISNMTSSHSHGLEVFFGIGSMKIEPLGKDNNNIICFVNQSGQKGVDYTMSFKVDKDNNIEEILSYNGPDYKIDYATKTEICFDTEKNVDKVRKNYREALKSIDNPIFEKEILGE